jgi:hypothetical protein
MGEKTPHGTLKMLLGWYFFNQQENSRVTPSSDQLFQRLFPTLSQGGLPVAWPPDSIKA